MAQGVRGRLRSRIFLTFGTTRVVRRQPCEPAAFTPGEIHGTHFQRLSRTQGGATEKIPSDTIGNRSRDRPTSRAVHYASSDPNAFEYRFNIVGKLPKSASSRTIPFALRDDVRAQIQDMLIDGILEESYSEYVNPLNLLLREYKPLSLRVDSRGVNREMTPDRVKVALMRELLQRLHGSRYNTTWFSTQFLSRYHNG